MPTLEVLKELGSRDSVDNEGFFAEFGQTQEKILKNFNTGVARLFGLPRAAVDLLETGENKLLNLVGIDTEKPSGKESFGLPTAAKIQSFGAKQGLTFEPGQEPQDLTSRITQNIGTVGPLLPLLGPAALIPELASAVTGAVGGKIVEGTEFGQTNPEIARAIGELGGGITPGVATTLTRFFKGGGTIGAGIRAGKAGIAKGKELLPKPRERAVGALRRLTPSPEDARGNLAREAASPEGKILTPGQAAGDIGIARLSRTVEAEVPAFAEEMAKQRIGALKELEKQFKGTGDIGDARAFIEADLAQKANLANIALGKASTTKDPAALSVAAEGIMRAGLNKARVIETQAWNSLPSGELASGSNLTSVIKKELGNITEGGAIGEISSFARKKLGRFVKNKETGKGRFIGGELFSKKKPNASAKAIHQFYSQLGRERTILSRQPGSANKIRIIDDLRAAALDDLDQAGLSQPYLDAISLSRGLNEKFTKGPIGKILGFARGETPSPTRALDEIIGGGGRPGKEAIQQALRGSPETKADIQDFIKTQFAIAAKDIKTNNINTVAGNRFIKKYEEILNDVFPSLKQELQEAIRRQSDVDSLIGVPTATRLSPLMKEKSAASVFLKANPNEEMQRIINSTSLQRADVLSDLVKLAKEDPTGRALSGLKNGFMEEVFESARKGEGIDGAKMLRQIKKLRPALLKSKLFDIAEIKRFVRIGDAFEKISFELSQKGLSGGIIDDIPSRLLSNSLRILAVRGVGFFKKSFGLGSSFGTSLQEANIVSSTAVRFAKGMTNDEARNLLIKAVRDKTLMDELLKDISKISDVQRQSIFSKITGKLDEIKGLGVGGVASATARGAGNIAKGVGLQSPRVSAIVPPVASLSGAPDTEGDRKQVLIDKLNSLKGR